MNSSKEINNEKPIGVFDSGIGGLSVLDALLKELPNEQFIYYADSENTPYGEKTIEFIKQRSHNICEALINQYKIKALVIACNTATAAAANELRIKYPNIKIIGIEPAIKPAINISKTKNIGVLATKATIEGDKLKNLIQNLNETQINNQTKFHLHACDGLAHAIELNYKNPEKIEDIIKYHFELLSKKCPLGSENNQIDTIVLGCTHYPLVLDLFKKQTENKNIEYINPASAVARQTKRILENQETKEISAKELILISKNMPLLNAAVKYYIN